MWARPSFDDTCAPIQADDTPRLALPDPNLTTRHCSALSTSIPLLTVSPRMLSCGFMPILMWQKPHLHPMTPFPFPECCCRAVFVCLPSSDLGTSHANLALGNPPSTIGPVPRHPSPFSQAKGILATSSQHTVVLAPFVAITRLFFSRQEHWQGQVLHVT